MSKRLLSFSACVIAVLVLAGARAASAQQVVKLGEGETLTITGFINASVFVNSGLFSTALGGQGQNSEFSAVTGDTTDKTIMDGDFRNTRLNFTFAAQPVLGKWAPKATVEFDFFGAFNGAPPFGDEQPQVRGRVIYADLTNGRTTLRIGQDWSLLFAETPVSLTHIAFPVGYGGGGKIGWRFPGIFLFHDLTVGKPVNVQLQLAAMKGSGPAVGVADAANGIGNGEASGMPQLEGRLNFTQRGKNMGWTLYAVGHLDWKDTSGTNRPGSNVSAWAAEGGGIITPGHFTLHGNVYYGKNIGQEFAHINQQLNIRGWGAWAQAGYDFTTRWSLWGFYGTDQPNVRRFIQDNPTAPAVARQQSHVGDALLRFRAGRYALGLEYFRTVTRWNTGPTNANQVALSVLYTL
jgi:hypothetical protein